MFEKSELRNAVPRLFKRRYEMSSKPFKGTLSKKRM